MDIEELTEGVDRVREALESKFWPNMIILDKKVQGQDSKKQELKNESTEEKKDEIKSSSE